MVSESDARALAGDTPVGSVAASASRGNGFRGVCLHSTRSRGSADPPTNQIAPQRGSARERLPGNVQPIRSPGGEAYPPKFNFPPAPKRCEGGEKKGRSVSEFGHYCLVSNRHSPPLFISLFTFHQISTQLLFPSLSESQG